MAVGAPRVVGVVLAGGRSTRFGSEKAVALVDGAPMIARIASVLARGCEAVAVNAPPASGAADWARARGHAVLPDLAGAPDGPLSGVLAGLEWARLHDADLLVTAPCDTPDLPRELVRRLAGELGDAPAAVATTTHGSHPLCTVWRVELLPRLEDELRRGHPSVRTWLAEIGAREVRFGRTLAFRNVNQPPRRAGWIEHGADVGALALLFVLALVGVTAILLVSTSAHAVDGAARLGASAAGRLGAALGLALTVGVVAAAVRLGKALGRR